MFLLARDAFQHAIQLIYPYGCLLCRRPISHSNTFAPWLQNIPVCPLCQDNISFNRPPFCEKCSRPIQLDRNPGHTCDTCQNHVLCFERAWGVCRYNETTRRLLHLYKYGRKTGLRHLYAHLVGLFLETYSIRFTDVGWVMPIPLHAIRMRERGFNQSEILARMISQDLGLPFSSRHLVRSRNTMNQAMLRPKERWTNIHGAFKINYFQDVQGENILLVDDLFTTGATCSEAARVLKAAGAGQVYVLALHIAVLLS